MDARRGILDGFESAGYRRTGARKVLAELVADRSDHFTAEDLLNDARARRVSVGRATIFRALDLLTELGLVERVDLPTGEHAFVVCEAEHHHHVVCSRCGRSAAVSDNGLETLADLVKQQTGFQVDTHRLELYGVCEACRKAGAS